MQKLTHPDCNLFYEFCWFKQSVLCKTLALCRLLVMSLDCTFLSHFFVIEYRIMILEILVLLFVHTHVPVNEK